jgi:hypothetical protein
VILQRWIRSKVRRQYFPKGTALSFHGAGYLDYVADEVNNRPRKRLDWKTPAEALDHQLSQPSTPVLRRPVESATARPSWFCHHSSIPRSRSFG